MVLNFPNYLAKKQEVVKGTGNAIVPEGTRVTWRINTIATQKVEWLDADSKFIFSKQENQFLLARNINQNTFLQLTMNIFIQKILMTFNHI